MCEARVINIGELRALRGKVPRHIVFRKDEYAERTKKKRGRGASIDESGTHRFFVVVNL